MLTVGENGGMTDATDAAPDLCLWCEADIPKAQTAGRPRLYCCEDCQRATENERRNLRALIARLEVEVIEQAGRFVFGPKDARPRLAAARERWEQIAPSSRN